MSTVAVAKKEFQDAVRSKVLIGVTALFVLFAAGTTFIYAQFIVDRVTTGLTTKGLIVTLYAGLQIPLFTSLGLSPVHVFLPFVGILLGYRSIVKERESGQIKLLLSLPHSRVDVVLGKLIGRTGVGTVAALSGFVLSVIIGLVMYQDFGPVEFAGFVLATLIFLAVYVSIGIAISSASPSTPIAIGAAAVYMVIFHALWGAIFLFAQATALNVGPNGRLPYWFVFLREINPARAYNHLVVLFAGLPTRSGAASLPIYLQNWFFLIVMAFWIVVPLGIGYALFEYADL